VEKIIPILSVRDVEASLKYYVEVLGFDICLRRWARTVHHDAVERP